MGLTRGASSAAANSPPNKKVKKVYNTNEQYDPTPMTSYAKRTGHPQVFDPVVPVYPEDCMYGKKGEPTQQMYNHVLGSVCNRLALRENFAECTLETQPDFKVCARVSWLPLTHMSLIAPTLQRRAATSHTRTTSRRTTRSQRFRRRNRRCSGRRLSRPRTATSQWRSPTSSTRSMFARSRSSRSCSPSCRSSPTSRRCTPSPSPPSSAASSLTFRLPCWSRAWMINTAGSPAVAEWSPSPSASVSASPSGGVRGVSETDPRRDGGGTHGDVRVPQERMERFDDPGGPLLPQLAAAAAEERAKRRTMGGDGVAHRRHRILHQALHDGDHFAPQQVQVDLQLALCHGPLVFLRHALLFTFRCPAFLLVLVGRPTLQLDAPPSAASWPRERSRGRWCRAGRPRCRSRRRRARAAPTRPAAAWGPAS